MKWLENTFKKDTQGPYRDFAPVDDIGEEAEYFRALDWALSNKKIYNVALSAPYGAGKSSVIESYIKRRKIKCLQLSLANFCDCKTKKVDVEKEFLKKLFYKVDYTKIPQSRYRKIHKISRLRILKYLIGLFIVIFGYTILFNQELVNNLLEKVDYRLGVIAVPTLARIPITLILVGLFVWLLVHFLKSVFSKWTSWEISIFEKAKIAANDDKKESIFNKYLDEIVYFFEETDYKVVFIEDLDRFNAVELFTKLRELNFLLNRYESIKRHITFVYAIRDDYFKTDLERTKFFDFIIPVIPYINATNSDDLLHRRINEIHECGVEVEISDDYIIQVSPYIGDMRILTSITNEFVTYKKIIKKDKELSLKDEQIFSLMVFKNLYPSDFADIEQEKGIIKSAFTAKKNFVEVKSKALQAEIEEAERSIQIHEEDILKDSREIKNALLQEIAPNYRILKIVAPLSGENYTYSQIMDPVFDMTVLKSKNLVVYFVQQNGYQVSQNIADLEEEYTKDGISYIERWKAAYECEGERKELLRHNLESKKDELYRLESLRIQELLQKYDAEEIFKDDILSNKLLVFFLRNGFIDETYVNYINYYHPDSISIQEHDFILNLRNHGGVKYVTMEMPHPERVIKKLVVHEFEQIEVLNFCLINCIFKSEKNEFGEKEYRLIRLLSSRTSETKDFIKRYLQEKTDTVGTFIERIASQNVFLWWDICFDDTIPPDIKTEYFDLILCNASIESIVAMNKFQQSVSSYMEKEGVFSSIKKCSVERIKEVVLTCDVKLSKTPLSALDKEMALFIIQNNAYSINRSMMTEVIKVLSPDNWDQSLKASFTALQHVNNGNVNDYVKSCINTYVENVVLAEENSEESKDAVEALFEIANYDVLLCQKIIKHQNIILNEINNLISCTTESNEADIHEIIDFMLENAKIALSWSVVEDYANQFGISNVLLDIIEISLNELCNEDNGPDENLIKALLQQDWHEDKIEIFAEHYHLDNSKDVEIETLTGIVLRVLLKKAYLAFSTTLVEKVYHNYPKLMITLCEGYKDAIIEVTDKRILDMLPIDNIVLSTIFSEEEKVLLINRYKPSVVSDTVAGFIMNHEGGFTRTYIEAAWENLSISDKEVLLSNHLEVFALEDLPELFLELSPEYHDLAKQSNHKVTLERTPVNERMLKKLKRMSYITSYGPVDMKKQPRLFGSQKKEYMCCRVKEYKSKTVVAN